MENNSLDLAYNYYKNSDNINIFREILCKYMYDKNIDKINQAYAEYSNVFDNDDFKMKISKLCINNDNLELCKFIINNKLEHSTFKLKYYADFYSEKTCPKIIEYLKLN